AGRSTMRVAASSTCRAASGRTVTAGRLTMRSTRGVSAAKAEAAASERAREAARVLAFMVCSGVVDQWCGSKVVHLSRECNWNLRFPSLASAFVQLLPGAAWVHQGQRRSRAKFYSLKVSKLRALESVRSVVRTSACGRTRGPDSRNDAAIRGTRQRRGACWPGREGAKCALRRGPGVLVGGLARPRGARDVPARVGSRETWLGRPGTYIYVRGARPRRARARSNAQPPAPSSRHGGTPMVVWQGRLPAGRPARLVRNTGTRQCPAPTRAIRSEEHTSELQSREKL